MVHREMKHFQGDGYTYGDGYQRGAANECADIVAYIRRGYGSWNDYDTLADAIERGEHLGEVSDEA